MLNYSTRVSLEVIFLLTVSEYYWFTLKIDFMNIQDLINQTQPSNKPSLAIMLVNDDILDALRYNYHPEHLCQNYFSVSSWTQRAMRQLGLSSTLSILLLRIWLMVGQRLPFLWNCSRIYHGLLTKRLRLFIARPLNWSINFQCSLNYLTSPEISSDDKTIQNKLKGDQNDLSGKTFPV